MSINRNHNLPFSFLVAEKQGMGPVNDLGSNSSMLKYKYQLEPYIKFQVTWVNHIFNFHHILTHNHSNNAYSHTNKNIKSLLTFFFFILSNIAGALCKN